MPLQIIRNDITRVKADAIVNTANPKPVYADGTDSAIYHAAGAEALLAERKKIGVIPRGEVAVTPAFALPARYIIHTVGPVYQDGLHGEFELLGSCYRKSLLLARQLGCESIAFPLISAGVYGFPKEAALAIALEEIADFLESFEMDVTLVVFDKRAFELSASLVADVGEYIDEHYVEKQREAEYGGGQSMPLQQAARRREDREFREPRTQAAPQREDSGFASYVQREDSAFSPHMGNVPHAESALPSPAEPDGEKRKESFWNVFRRKKKASLADVIKQPGETFQERLFRFIDDRGLTDAQVYKKANLDRKLFSKIRCSDEYIPRKRTVLALAIALRLNLDETLDLLRSAGFALSPGSRADLIVAYCIQNNIYDIYRINALLFEYDQPCLG